ncbi:pentatricopeptide repeat-containing protein At5g56310-like [Gastrolobium bilobum]|uniref:pentatricopeptide repeat-containing protein At5g56310-like n=1 Tax=Gastrolobium bilobum TaxID=150636 RepID=UPI002AB1FE4C|nr:pentatricopeptide repeat-containing protein At5g56310-like [Gastrolobium bilobum]
MLPPKLQRLLKPCSSTTHSQPWSLRTLSTIAPPDPNPTSLSLLADKCTSMAQLKQVHAQMIVSARINDHFAASRLLSSCAVSTFGDLNHASRIFSSIHRPNTFMWNTLIRAHAQAGGPHSLFLYVNMRKLGALPGKHTFPFLLKACSHLPSLPACKQVHTHVLKFGLGSDLHVVNGLVRCYSVSGDLVDARFVFDEIPEKSLSLWTTMICGYAQNFCSNEALALFDGMIVEGFEPNGATLASVLSACARSGCLRIGERIHKFMKVKGVEVGVILGTALIYMYAKNGAIVMARKLFDEMPERNIVTWNAMICGLAAHGHVEDALSLFEKLKKEQVVVPNDVTFIGVLSACCHAGLLEVGRNVFCSMKTVYGIEPKIEHYGCLVDLLGKGGKLLEAEELIKGMPWKADVVILGALLAASKNKGNTEVAERAVKEILALEPRNHGVHVALSNMYAEAGQWQEVLRLRKMMKEERLKKAPGWSLVAT